MTAGAWALLGGAALLACAPSSPSNAPKTSASVEAEPAQPASGWESGERGRFHSKRFLFTLPLPDGKGWKIDDRKGEWLVAKHPGTDSVVRARVLHDAQPVNRSRCVALARAEDPSLPSEERGRIIDSSDAVVIPGWDARSLTLLLPDASSGNAVEAQQFVVAASIRRCFLLHFTTRAAGNGAEAVVGARLGELSELLKLTRFDESIQGPEREAPPF